MPTWGAIRRGGGSQHTSTRANRREKRLPLPIERAVADLWRVSNNGGDVTTNDRSEG